MSDVVLDSYAAQIAAQRKQISDQGLNGRAAASQYQEISRLTAKEAQYVQNKTDTLARYPHYADQIKAVTENLVTQQNLVESAAGLGTHYLAKLRTDIGNTQATLADIQTRQKQDRDFLIASGIPVPGEQPEASGVKGGKPKADGSSPDNGSKTEVIRAATISHTGQKGVGYFDNNSTTLTDSDKKALDKLASAWTQNPTQKIDINGMATGQGRHNTDLAKARAEAAKSYLMQTHHIGAESIHVESHAGAKTRSVAFGLGGMKAEHAALVATTDRPAVDSSSTAPSATNAVLVQTSKNFKMTPGIRI